MARSKVTPERNSSTSPESAGFKMLSIGAGKIEIIVVGNRGNVPKELLVFYRVPEALSSENDMSRFATLSLTNTTILSRPVLPRTAFPTMPGTAGQTCLVFIIGKSYSRCS